MIRCLVLLPLLLTAATAATLADDYGNLEGEWRFQTDPAEAGEGGGWALPEFDDRGWRTISVPGYWEPQGVTDTRPGQPPRTSPATRWTDYDGVAWYRLRFTVPADWAGKPLILRLGSVDDRDRTWLNGQLVGETGPGIANPVSVHRRYELKPTAVRYGADNVLAIRVTDSGGPGGLMGPEVSLLPRTEGTPMVPREDRPLAERFANPPGRARILKIVHGLPDQPEAQAELLDTLIRQGFGGMVTNVSFTDYLRSEAKWEAFTGAVERARTRGMALWLYDEKGYPSGTAGGLTLSDHPEWEARGLLCAETESAGGEVALEMPPGELVLAAAYPVREAQLDLAGAVRLETGIRAGKLHWQAPAGLWRIFAVTEDRLFEGTHAAISLSEHQPYINLLSPEPTARFLELTHAAYAARLGDDLGRHFIATFTDEPSLMSVFFRPMPYRPLPYSPELSARFRQRHGRPLVQVLPALLAPAPGAERIRHDFWSSVAELVADNYFGQIERWCAAHGLPSGGHLLAEESLVGHVPLYGDFYRCIRQLGAPSIDCLTSLPAQVPWRIAKLIGSVADLTGRPITMSETSDHSQRYRAPGDQRPVQIVSEEEIRGTCNRLILGGISTITSYYSFSKLSSGQLRSINNYVGRCCTMLAGGHQVTDIALLYPIETVWTRFTPSRHGSSGGPAAARVEATYNGALDALYTARRDPTIIDSHALIEAKVEGGTLRHGQLRWRVVVLPGVDTLPIAAWRNLKRFWDEGGVVVALGATPRHSESEFPSAEVMALSEAMFGPAPEAATRVNDAGGAAVYLPSGSDALLTAVLDNLLDAEVKALPRSPLRAAHRRIDGHELYFIINDSGAAVDEAVSVAATGPGELYRPDTGEITPLAGSQGVRLALPPYGGALLRFALAEPPARRRAAPGALAGLVLSDLPAVTPSAGKGEFVTGSLEPDTERSTPDQPFWRAEGTLTRSAVDTFLFVSFDYGQPLELTAAACLAVDVNLPPQATATQLLVILHERDGGDYLAATGRGLSEPGAARLYVPLTGFRLMGHSKDPNGRLDLDRIEAIRVGWGGYFGQQGERVVFSLAAPRLATAQTNR